MNANVDWSQLRDLFPIAGRIIERQVLRFEALKKLQWTRREEDEAEQLRKVKAREILTSLVKLEEWR